LLIVRVEFSSEKQRRERSAELNNATEPFIPSCVAVLSDRQKNNVYDQQDDGHDDTNADYFTSPVGSSLIGHTGHSADDLFGNKPARGVATTANDHRPRRFGWLPSA
jgi:DnaJ-class molecular chaperone